ncbi:tetratricopeptide repeat protein [Roseimaritima sediminicola]|uniref:tetratricopeptide repeat protein n=1 Tax=Roseimaritima sediminicola TaxID=2662066 RepID=UPI001F33F61D|nr:tetratricopeptide repeat protein [Roseimaritima sediminicola]
MRPHIPRRSRFRWYPATGKTIFMALALTLAGAGVDRRATVFGEDSHRDRHAAAIARAEAWVAAGADSPSLADAYVRLGDAFLRGGRTAEAVESFEHALRLHRESGLRRDLRPYLWQYGIALYFEGRFADGRRLFEAHRRVNPHDVENAAWHFLCAARETDLSRARDILLPAPADRRAPMKQILARLAGGDDAEILAATEALQDTPAHAQARFYADLYIGLIADAEGRRDKAQKYLDRAAASDLTHYMADVARVYAAHLR